MFDMDAVVAREVLAALVRTPVAETEGEAFERIRAYEELKAALAGAQARETVRARELREAAETERGVPAERRCRGFASEVALARRESPSRGSRHVGLARALADEMPRTMQALSSGRIDEWKATVVARETGWLSADDRRRVDAELGDRLEGLGARRLEREARVLAQSLDAAGAVAHLRRAENERRVTIRPAPDAMAYLTALLPMKQAVSAFATLDRDARSLISTGEAGERGRGQVMADLCVERLTGVSHARELPVEVHLIMSDRTAFDGSGLPAWIPGQGPVPADAARDMLQPETTERAWLRRLYADPQGEELVAMDARRRTFPPMMRRMIQIRDDVCRTPWCDAPIRHADHIVPVADGGATTLDNASGLCEQCNQTKEVAGWRHESGGDGLTVTTPSGHRFTGTPPGHPLLRAQERVSGSGFPGLAPGSAVESAHAEWVADIEARRRERARRLDQSASAQCDGRLSPNGVPVEFAPGVVWLPMRRSRGTADGVADDEAG